MKQNFLRKPFPYKYNRTVLGLIGLNVLAFLVCFSFPAIKAYGALNPYAVVVYKMYWQFASYMFLHQNISHLFFNMLGLLIFGIQVEKTIGSTEFVIFYFFCGILSGILSFGYYYFTGQIVMLIGASGVVYAVMFAYAVLFPRSIFFIWGIIPVPAPIMVLIYTIIEIVSQFMLSSNVAHLTHLFGFFAAWLYFVVRMGIHPLKIWKKYI